MSSGDFSEGIAIGIEPLPPLDDLERQWRGFDASGPHSFFVTWSWIGTWLRTVSGAGPLMLLAARCGGEIAGMAILSPRAASIRGIVPTRQAWLNSTGEPQWDCITIEHNGFASNGNRGDALNEALVTWFAHEAVPFDEFIIPGIAEWPSAESRLIVKDRVETGYRTPLAQIMASGGFETLLSRNARQQLRRSLRAYERESALTIERASDVPTAQEYFSQLKALHIRSWQRRGRPHAFTSAFFETFHRALIAEGCASGAVDLLRITAGARAIGYLYNFRRNGIVSAYQSGFEDEDSALRPGYVCHALAVEYYARAGMSVYDFLAGTNRLKQSFGTERYALCWRRLRKPTLGFRAERAAEAAVRAFKGPGKK